MRLVGRMLVVFGSLIGAQGALARLPEPVEALPDYSSAATGEVNVQMRYGEGATMINRMLNEQGFWGDAYTYDYANDKTLYDEIRLKPVSDGYVPMITGESDEDIPSAVVADIIFGHMGKLPKYMEGAVAVETLGSGTDTRFNLRYVDSYYVLDLTFFYVTYSQRMYRMDVGDRSLLWFEKLDQSFVDAETWTRYQGTIDKTMGGLNLRSFMGTIVPVQQIYGIFIVSKGSRRTSRVTFVSKLVFGDDAGWIARFGSKLRPVLKAGLQHGFDAAVAIAKAERDRRHG